MTKLEMNMRSVLGPGSLLAMVLVVAWLAAGRQITSVLDRFITIRIAFLPVAPLRYDGGGLVIGQLSMTFGTTDNLPFDLALRCDSLNRVVLSTGAGSFTLGPRTNPVDPSGRPDINFTAEPGDQLSFTATRSILGWPTPFDYNFMALHSPWWKRYVYYRLAWKKAGGAKLEMIWRYEQHYYWSEGWTKPEMLWNWYTGLVGVEIQPSAPGQSGR